MNNRYAGQTCHVIGRGPTDFDYSELGRLRTPVFFINDAICLEKHVESDSFFFAHDSQLRVWLDGSIRSTAVLPIEGTVLEGPPLEHTAPVILYHRVIDDREGLLRMNRDQVAARAGLFVHSGTIHSAIHFAWFCGFSKIVFIGCDGINPADLQHHGYDPRLANRSNSSPDHRYDKIRKAQDLMVQLFGLSAEYAGTPPVTLPIPR